MKVNSCDSCISNNRNAFSQLSLTEITHLDTVKDVLFLKKGDTLFSEGKTIGGIYCLKSGKCKVSRLNGNGKEQIVRFIKAGDLIGYRSLFNDEPVSLAAAALEDIEVCFIPKKEVMLLIKTNHDFALAMLEEVCHVLKVTNESLAKMAQKSVKERLADTLLQLEESFGLNKHSEINLKLSREELASYIGTATESAIRLISEFKRKNLITVNGKLIAILDKEGLKHIAEGF